MVAILLGGMFLTPESDIIVKFDYYGTTKYLQIHYHITGNVEKLIIYCNAVIYVNLFQEQEMPLNLKHTIQLLLDIFV